MENKWNKWENTWIIYDDAENKQWNIPIDTWIRKASSIAKVYRYLWTLYKPSLYEYASQLKYTCISKYSSILFHQPEVYKYAYPMLDVPTNTLLMLLVSIKYARCPLQEPCSFHVSQTLASVGTWHHRQRQQSTVRGRCCGAIYLWLVHAAYSVCRGKKLLWPTHLMRINSNIDCCYYRWCCCRLLRSYGALIHDVVIVESIMQFNFVQ